MKACFMSLWDKQRLGIVALIALVLFAAATLLPATNLAAASKSEATDKSDKKKKKSEKEKKTSRSDDDNDDWEKSSDADKLSRQADKKQSSRKKESKDSKPSGRKNSPPTVNLTAAVVDPSNSPIEMIHATFETDPVPNANDAADDPAIWVNPGDPSQSTIIGTDKQGGIGVYDLSGKQLQYLKIGNINNIDIRAGFKLGGERVALVAGGNRSDNSVALYRVNPKTRLLEDVAAGRIITGQVYGSCMYRSVKTEKYYYFVTAKSGAVEQWELSDNGAGKVAANKVRSFKVGSVTEGCVADDELGQFYVSEEAVGVWKYGAEPDSGDARTQVDKTGSGGHLVADVEGMTIVYGMNGTGYLIVSSQGNHAFVVYRREGRNEHVKTFRIAPGETVDGSEETDGIDAVAVDLGPAFPHGVFVAQDGYNDNGNQNFKLVPLERIIGPAKARTERSADR